MHNSNTSHVILYPFCISILIIPHLHSNTSHVILYHRCQTYSTFHKLFKYISCYSLSSSRVPSCPSTVIQIHLMLFFIPRAAVVPGGDRVIQIHLMLFFILSSAVHLDTAQLFKYISCYSLSPSLALKAGASLTFKYISCYSLSFWKEVQDVRL